MSKKRVTRKPSPARTTSQSPLVSLKMVAEKAGVSTATVSRIINNSPTGASKATREHVLRIVADLEYRPSGAGSALRKQQSRIVALIVSDTKNAFIAAVAAAIEPQVRKLGKFVVLCETHEQPNIQDEYIREMRAQLVSAFIILGAVPSPQLKELVANGEPIVFMMRKSPYPSRGIFVGIDDRRAGAEIARFFVKNDLLPTGAIHAQAQSSARRERLDGFRKELKAHGYALDPAHVKSAAAESHVDIGYKATKQLLLAGHKLRSILCVNDFLAYGAHKSLEEADLRVPEEVLLFGFDDNPLNEWLAPWLSTIGVPTWRLGEAVADVLERFWSGQIADSTSVIIPYTFINRTALTNP